MLKTRPFNLTTFIKAPIRTTHMGLTIQIEHVETLASTLPHSLPEHQSELHTWVADQAPCHSHIHAQNFAMRNLEVFANAAQPPNLFEDGVGEMLIQLDFKEDMSNEMRVAIPPLGVVNLDALKLQEQTPK